MKATFRKCLKELADRLGYRVTAKSEPPLTVEQFIRHAFPVGTKVRFLQVGAHDAGSFNDPINAFRNEATWSGTLVEPNPAIFPRLATPSAHPRCKAVNVAIADADGEYGLLRHQRCRVDQAAAFWADQITSLDRQHVIAVLKSWGHAESETDDLITAIQVPTLTFASLLAAHGADGIDLLFVDAEGYDFKLLKSFPFEQHRPAMIVFEYSRPQRERDRAGARISPLERLLLLSDRRGHRRAK